MFHSDFKLIQGSVQLTFSRCSCTPHNCFFLKMPVWFLCKFYPCCRKTCPVLLLEHSVDARYSMNSTWGAPQLNPCSGSFTSTATTDSKQTSSVFVFGRKLSATLWKLTTESALSPLHLLLHPLNDADGSKNQMQHQSWAILCSCAIAGQLLLWAICSLVRFVCLCLSWTSTPHRDTNLNLKIVVFKIGLFSVVFWQVLCCSTHHYSGDSSACRACVRVSVFSVGFDRRS